MGRLTGKRILVTGAGGNLGSAIARAYLAEGADLILTSLTSDRIDVIAAEARDKGQRGVHIAANLNVDGEVDSLAEQAWRAFGGVDVVFISSQPTNPNMGDLLTTSDDNFRQWFHTIVWGPMRLLRHLGPKMIEAGKGGSIITVTSSTGDDPEPGFDAYGLGKAGLWWMTRAMAREWGKHGIRANGLQPGLVATAGNIEELEAIARKSGLLKRTALDRIGANADCIGAAIFLASDESAYMSAQRLKLDGGRF